MRVFVFVSSQLKFLLNTTKCRSSWYNIEQARPVADDSAETFLSPQASVNDAHITTIYSWFSHTPANHNCAEIVTNWTSYRSVDDSYVSRPIKIFKNCSFITYQNRTLVITEDPLKSDRLKNVTYISTLKNSSRPPLKHITLAMPPSGGIHAQSLWDELFLTRQQVLTDSEEEVYPLPTPIPIFSPNDTRNGSTTRQRKKRTSQNSRLQPDLVRKRFNQWFGPGILKVGRVIPWGLQVLADRYELKSYPEGLKWLQNVSDKGLTLYYITVPNFGQSRKSRMVDRKWYKSYDKFPSMC